MRTPRRPLHLGCSSDTRRNRNFKFNYKTVNPIMFRKEWCFSKLPVLRSHKNVFHTAFASTLTSGHLKC